MISERSSLMVREPMAMSALLYTTWERDGRARGGNVRWPHPQYGNIQEHARGGDAGVGFDLGIDQDKQKRDHDTIVSTRCQHKTKCTFECNHSYNIVRR
jgi:hypothetical protein